MTRGSLMIGATLAAALLAGCNRNCQNSCSRIYDDCGISLPGLTQADSVSECLASCEGAMRNAGTLGDYNPLGRNISGETHTLENEIQAASWIDCVWDVDCENIFGFRDDEGALSGQQLCW